MLSIALGPLAVFVFPLLWATMAVLLNLQGYKLWASILLGFFVELAAIVVAVTAVVNVANGKTVFGKDKPATGAAS